MASYGNSGEWQPSPWQETPLASFQHLRGLIQSPPEALQQELPNNFPHVGVWWMTFWITLWKKLSLYHVHWEKSMRSTDMTMAMAGSMSEFGNAHKYSHTSARITAPCAQLAKVNTTSGKRWPTLTRENPPTPPKKNSPKIIRFRIPPNLVPEILGDWKWFHTPSPFFINWVGLLEVFFLIQKLGKSISWGKQHVLISFFLGTHRKFYITPWKNGGCKTTFLFGT